MAAESPRIKALRSAPLNSWVAFDEGETRIVATASTYEQVVKESNAAGVADPIVVKTPPEWSPLSV
jgi:hypothetical protein